MKKIVLALIAAVTINVHVQAQDNSKVQKEGKRPDKTEMVKHHTERMVKEYGLSDKQAKKLLTLNTKYADKMKPMRHGHPKGPRPEEGNQADTKKVDGNKPPQKPQGETRPEGQGKRPTEAEMKQMKADRDAYNAELKKIMTDEQYKKYQDNEKKRHQHKHGPKGGQGHKEKND